MVARKSLTLPNGSASVKVATSTFVSGTPSDPCTATEAAVSGASAMVIEPVIVAAAVPGASSAMVTEMGEVPSSWKVWAPLMVKVPPPPVMVPGVIVPSPQSIEAVKSEAVFVGKPGLLIVATGPL